MFNTLSNVEFVLKVNPGQHLVIPEGSTGTAAASSRKDHDDKLKEFISYDQTDKAFKSLLIAAADDECIRILRHKHVGYANVTTLAILNHLYSCYAGITPTDLEENDKRLKESYDPNQTFETLIGQVEEAMEYAAV